MSKATEIAKQQKMAKILALTNPPRISQTEKEQLKTVFGTEPEIYMAMRDCFYGFYLDEYQKQLLKGVLPVKNLVRKVFYPEIGKELAFGQSYDLWQTQDLKTATSESFGYLYDAKVVILEMLEKSLKRLEDPDQDGVSLAVDKDLARLIARNGYISYIDQQIRFLMHFAVSDTLSSEEIQAMLRANSAR